MAEGHRKRMYKRFYDEGIDNFHPHEVLEMILYYSHSRRDTNPLAHNLINEFGSFHGVLDASYQDLTKFGLSDGTATLLKLIPAFSNYYRQSHAKSVFNLSDSTAMGSFAVDKIGQRENEVFALICLDAQRHLKKFEIVEEGTVNHINVSPRKVAECALRNNAVMVVLVHNHPGGSLIPSSNDINLTKSLHDILTPIGISLVDHIIVANGRFSSMSEQNLI